MATVCSWTRCSAVPVVALCGSITSARAASPLDELAKRSTEHGEIRSVTSTTADPIGKDGLWGLDGTFVVRAGCGSSYEALIRVTEYPRHTNKVKRVKVLSEEEGSLKRLDTSSLGGMFADDEDGDAGVGEQLVQSPDAQAAARGRVDDEKSPFRSHEMVEVVDVLIRSRTDNCDITAVYLGYTSSSDLLQIISGGLR